MEVGDLGEDGEDGEGPSDPSGPGDSSDPLDDPDRPDPSEPWFGVSGAELERRTQERALTWSRTANCNANDALLQKFSQITRESKNHRISTNFSHIGCLLSIGGAS